jgi:hypothetical protein
MPRPIQGICSDNHRSEGSKQLSTSRCFSCQRDRHRLVSHLILKKIVELDFVILISSGAPLRNRTVDLLLTMHAGFV